MRPVKSAERTLALLELFSLRQRPMTVTRIVEELAVPQASTSMLLAHLRELGYLTYDPARRTYAPTIRVALLGSWISHQFDEAGSLTARLTELRELVDETVFVGIQNGAHAQYVLVLYRDRPRSMKVQSGQLRLLTGSAVGRSLMALMPDAEVRSWVHRCNAEAAEDRLRVVPSAFMERIGAVRANGYAQTAGDITQSFGAIAVTAPAPMGLSPMAIGVGVPLERIDARRDLIVDALFGLKSVLTTLASSPGAVSAD